MLNRIKPNISENKFLFIKHLKAIIFTLIVFFIAFSLLKFPDVSAAGAYNGITLCIKSLIPSLFPFMIVSSVFVQSGVSEKICAVFEVPSRILFKQPPISFSVILLSQVGGFPVGAALIKRLFETGKLSALQAKHLMLFCINPGPGFVIGYVGCSLFHSKEIGLIIYASVVFSSLLIGFLSSLIIKNEPEQNLFQKETETNINAALIVNCVKKSAAAMGVICAWVILFSAVCSLIDEFDTTPDLKAFAYAFLEVTNACKKISTRYPVSLVAGAIGWSGACIHFQVMDTVLCVKLKLKHFLTARLLNAAVSIVICEVLLRLFKVTVPTMLATKAELVVNSSSVWVTLCMILMCLLMLVGDLKVFEKK